ncbi:TIGR03087 family PEP-CTERM/XrtA system glycosyltransferase [Novosphingobium sp.]|uniref:TIGR03087 family PEP-CTERM/XrtA system glycosyltransferase n=1 Tax=Novosphingobium sp. TaxID=1874826 RepID=UPI0035B1F223
MPGQEILFLAHRVPFPPNRGDKIRSHHVLRHLAALAPVHVASFADDAADLAEAGNLAQVAASHCLIRRSKPLPLAGLEAVVTGKPISLTAFDSPAIRDYVARILRERPIGAIYVFSGQMGQYVPANFAGRVVFDCVDVDSAKFEAYAAAGHLPMRWVNAREGRKLGMEEARLAARSDVTLLVSDEEAALFRARLSPELAVTREVRALRNGIDADFFDRQLVEPAQDMRACPGPRLIFTGQMDYAPNIAAARRAIERLLPVIRQVHPGASFHVVGRNPPADLLACHGKGGAHVWGGVPDIREWLAAADLALVPLEIARGVQNKVLEAMAMGLPAVLSDGAATGIGGVNGLHYLAAMDDAALVQGCLSLLERSEQAAEMGRAARRFVIDELSWPATLAPLAAMLGLEPAAARHAA